MMRTAFLGLAAAMCLTAATVPPATDIMNEAQSAAAAQHKSIFLIFHASWWGWCSKLDKFIETPEIKPIIDKYFVLTKLVVQESEKKKALENPGADAIMKQVGGEKAGLPFFAFLDEKGEMIANTMRPAEGSDKGGNIGHPFEPKEVDWFLVMVKKAAPSITADETKTLENWLRAQKK